MNNYSQAHLWVRLSKADFLLKVESGDRPKWRSYVTKEASKYAVSARRVNSEEVSVAHLITVEQKNGTQDDDEEDDDIMSQSLDQLSGFMKRAAQAGIEQAGEVAKVGAGAVATVGGAVAESSANLVEKIAEVAEQEEEQPPPKGEP